MEHWGKPPDLGGKRVTVMGLGRFGGGVAAVRFLTRRGARVTLTDLLPEAELAESLAQLEGCPLAAAHLGGHVERDFTETDLVVVNPAVRRDNRFLELARQARVPLSSEMNLFWQFHRGHVVGVTGSNGKSTTAALIHSILQAAGYRCRLGGNIGQSLLPVVDEIQPEDWTVLELSSFQLDDLDRLQASPEVAVVTNFSPNHLDWHGSVDEYRRAKQTILRWQSPRAAAVLNQDDPDVSTWPTNGRRFLFSTSAELRPTVAEFARIRADADAPRLGEHPNSCEFGYRPAKDERVLPIADWLRLPGRHNLQNALAAACAAIAIGVDNAAIQRGLEQFAPLPHRLQFVGEVAGRKFYNDSLATTPESVQVALDAFSAPVVLLAGGYDKQVDLTSMAQAIAAQAKAVALMGQTAAKLAELIAQRRTDFQSVRPADGTRSVPATMDFQSVRAALVVRVAGSEQNDGPAAASPGLRKASDPATHSLSQETARAPKPLRLKQCTSFPEAFAWAVAQSVPGDIVLLSPGCASYDWFRNFAHRGDEFVRLVGELPRTTLS